jgi:hypothetical protein
METLRKWAILINQRGRAINVVRPVVEFVVAGVEVVTATGVPYLA